MFIECKYQHIPKPYCFISCKAYACYVARHHGRK